MTCKECIHYEACKYLTDVIDNMTGKLNDKFDLQGDARVPKCGFPFDDSNGVKICNNQAHRDRYIKLPFKIRKMQNRKKGVY